ncbi:hypothetical protein IEQ34_016363 [Dendrobium chrysotoxum]|uniref:Uncharacterized protein n=1 Tax=Dendrobium chrysotoxum TaxID=161865 RepID=A0AAV7FXW1_DENCH|nr:hypothetical protein IEQ34_016363 [Dendrobium chrysotoxum]
MGLSLSWRTPLQTWKIEDLDSTFQWIQTLTMFKLVERKEEESLPDAFGATGDQSGGSMKRPSVL